MSFTLAQVRDVPALGLRLEEWRHPCGALHLHLACPDEHRAFAVAFRTPPEDDSGLPHILEHTTLCGSVRYPVRDPFFNMLRRSLQTFMNAMTYPDMTVYPFSSQVAKDFSNLLDVYLDAVFAPRLDPLDFAQEGHRLEPEGAGFVRKGVVYNEMKGALDGSDEQLALVLGRQLFADTCYRWCSGGDPVAIPRLRHADLVAFHRRCYRPANACFATYGDWAPAELHRRLAPYLAETGKALPPPAVQAPPRKPALVEVPVPLAEGQDPLDVATCTLNWVWGDSTGLDEALEAELLERLLLGNAASPLRRCLESSGLGRSAGPSSYNGYQRAGVFSAGLAGCAPARHGELAPLVRGCIEALVRDGLPAAEIEAALHQLELSRREIRGDHYPYGLELCLRAVPPWNHGVDALPFLDQSAAIAALRARAGDPAWLGRELRRRILDNPCLELRAVPDATWHARRDAAEAAAAAARAAAGLAPLAPAAQALAERQDRRDDPAVLPDLALADVPAQRRWATGSGSAPLVFSPGTNGLLHHLVYWELPALDDADIDLVPMLAALAGQLGAANRGYEEQARRIDACCGNLSAWTEWSCDGEGRLRALLCAEVKGLAARQGDFLPLFHETLERLRFDESRRLAEILDQAVQRMQERVPQAGNQFAARAAARGLHPLGALNHRLFGLGRLARLRRWSAEAGQDAASLAALGERLARLRGRILGGPAAHALIGDAAARDEVVASWRRLWAGRPASTAPAFAAPAPAAAPATAYTTASGVSYCALAFAAPPLGDPDAAALAVAGRLATHQVLHPRIREKGGAYGGGASYQGGSRIFALSSYRDPRLDGTYADFRDCLRWLADCPQDAQMLKEAILGVIASLDAPGSPAGEARSRFLADAKGSGPAVMDGLRARVLACSAEDVRRACRRHLPADGGAAAVVSGPAAAKASSLGWIQEAI